MNGTFRHAGIGVGGILLLVLFYVILNPIPGPADDSVAAALGGFHAMKLL